MAVDYDLVILGGTPEGYAAAAYAVQSGARAALVLQAIEGARSPLICRGILNSSLWDSSARPLLDSAGTPWQWVKQRAMLIADTLTGDDAQQLMVQGCDVIAESGHMVSDCPLTVATTSRRLSTRALLVATGHHFRAPLVPGLEAVPYKTPETFWQWEQLPSSVAILGSRPEGLALAQWLRRWQIPVTVVTANAEVLTIEDPDVSRWLGAQLRAQGVDLRCAVRVENVSAQASDITLKLAEDVVRAEALVVAVRPVPYTENLGLGVCLSSERPSVNAYLQTQHPRIYICGAAIGGDDFPAIARQEAQWAVQNALFWPRQRVHYAAIPYDLPTQPPLARVGWTESQALERFGRDRVLVAQQSLYDNPPAQWRESTVGFCKLIAHRDGRLLGCHGVGPAAPEWVQTMALLMTASVPWWRLASFPALPYSLTELLRQAAQQWERDRWQPGRWRRNWAENWCNWRRSR
ncbi:MAG: FAD-dependent oxidoreductase [Cyanobacteria bacterium P01_C01_bin.70]